MLSTAAEVAGIWFAAASALAVPLGRMLHRADAARLARARAAMPSADRPPVRRPVAVR